MVQINRKFLKTRENEPVIYLIDLFAGAGGTSTAANYSSNKIRVIYCINHDPTAIRSHAENHPDCIHSTEDIRYANLSDISEIVKRLRKENPNCKIAIWASLECTHFSKAKGGQSRDADSRSLAQHMFRYESIIKPDFFWFENVREFLSWGPIQIKPQKFHNTYTELAVDKNGDYIFVPNNEKKCSSYNQWVEEFKRRGFHYDYRLLNSADYGGYTIRTRYFGQFSKDPDLIAWPKQTHHKKGLNGLRQWKAVKEVLDLDDHGNSIFNRKKPFSDSTYERIYAGLKKFVANGDDSFMAKYYSGNPDGKVISMDGPAGTIKTVDGHSVVFTHRYNGGHPDQKVKSVEEPINTITTQSRQAVVQCICLAAYYGTTTLSDPDNPCGALTTKDRFVKIDCEFLLDYQGKGITHSKESPSPSLLTKDKYAPIFVQFLDNQYGNSKPTSLLVPCGTIPGNPKQNVISCELWIMDTQFKNTGKSVDDPSGVITANRKYHYLVNPQYGSKGGSIDDPCFTLIARTDKSPPQLVSIENSDVLFGIAIYESDTEIMKKIKYFMAHYGIADIKQRMLKIVEMKRIQGFPEDYILHGTQQEQKRGIGNSVEVFVGKALFKAITFNYRLKHNVSTKKLLKTAA